MITIFTSDLCCSLDEPYYGDCRVVESHHFFRHPLVLVEGNFNATVHKFISEYNSHLYSSFKGVDPQRLASLLSFLSKLSE
jgi:hypothetical protein